MSQKPVRGDNHATSRHEAETDALLRGSVRAAGLEGKPLTVQSNPFGKSDVSIAGMIGGMLGPPAWSVRLKQIHDGRMELTARLDAEWARLARRYQQKPEEFSRRWRGYLAALDLALLNTLITKHNAYYPIEARIPIIWPTGQYRIPTGIEYPQQPLAEAQLLDQYPADLDMALYFGSRPAEQQA